MQSTKSGKKAESERMNEKEKYAKVFQNYEN